MKLGKVRVNMKQVGYTLCPLCLTTVLEISDEDEDVAESFPASCSRVCLLDGEHVAKEAGLTKLV
jgi:hypothetical protein